MSAGEDLLPVDGLYIIRTPGLRAVCFPELFHLCVYNILHIKSIIRVRLLSGTVTLRRVYRIK